MMSEVMLEGGRGSATRTQTTTRSSTHPDTESGHSGIAENNLLRLLNAIVPGHRFLSELVAQVSSFEVSYVL